MTNKDEDFQVFTTFLEHNESVFMNQFNLWDPTIKEDKNNFEYRKVNLEFEELFGEESVLKACDIEQDYNFIVDYIF